MTQMSNRFAFRKLRQPRAAGLSFSIPCRMIASSSGVVPACSRGSSRYHLHQNTLQITPRIPKIKKDTLQPANAMIATTIGGASAPPNRVPMNKTPCALPTSRLGNHREKLREIVGKAPASPTPNRNLVPSSTGKFHANPVAIVNADHQTTIRVIIRRGPNTSASHPLGISKTAYANVKMLNVHPS